MARPMLDDIELQNVQYIEVDGDQVLTQHDIPALEGDFFQRLGRRASQVTLTGVLTGPDAQADSAAEAELDVKARLKRLRDKFRAATPVSFVADITTSTRIDQVLIEEMGVRELAGKPERFEYTFTLREYIPAPERRQKKPPDKKSSLLVTVIVEGEPDYDYNTITVSSNIPGYSTLTKSTNQSTDNTWQEREIPPGNYTVTATPPTDEIERRLRPKSESVQVPKGGQGTVTIILRREGTATLIVHVKVEGHPDFDFSTVTVTVHKDEALFKTLNRVENTNTWREENFPAGTYTVKAETDELGGMSETESAQVPEVGTEEVTITLRTGNQKVVKYLVVHFWFDKSFIEPCMRAVMREVAKRLKEHGEEKLVILGHTDKQGPDIYNQFLSERRARSAYAYLTFGRDSKTEAEAVDEWDRLRRQRPPGTERSIHDTWGAREYQYMLQDLGYYRGNITEVHDEPTSGAVRNFQRKHQDDDKKPLVIDGVVGDKTWRALIRAYLEQDSLDVKADRFLLNVNAEKKCDGSKDTKDTPVKDGGIVKWLGTGEDDPVKNGGPTRNDGNTIDAWRPNRRTEFLFVKESKFPSEVAEPATLQMPPLPGGRKKRKRRWCLGDSNSGRNCFVEPHVPPRKSTCPSNGAPWSREPVHPETLQVKGSIQFEDGRPLANAEYVLLSADGEYLHKGADGEPDLGEVPQKPKPPKPARPRKGRPILPYNRTDKNGKFNYPRDTPAGVYVLEVKGPYVLRVKDRPNSKAKGNIVCKSLNRNDSKFDVIVTAVPTSLEFVHKDNVDREIDRVKWKEDFRLRADFPGITEDEITIEVSSYLLRRLK